MSEKEDEEVARVSCPLKCGGHMVKNGWWHCSKLAIKLSGVNYGKGNCTYTLPQEPRDEFDRRIFDALGVKYKK